LCSTVGMMNNLILPAGVRKRALDPPIGVADIIGDRSEQLKHREPSVENTGVVHGKRTVRSESVAKCLSSMRISGADTVMRDLAESIYRSRRIEPLGKSRNRQFSLPPATHSYGKPLRVDESISDVIHGCGDHENKSIHELYKKSHHAYHPGERVDRKYTWPKEITQDFQFGSRDTKSESASLALRWKGEVK
jgi:hypothetical protein